MSVLRSAEECKRRKAKRLRKVNIIGKENFAELNLDVKVELIKSLIPLGLMYMRDLLYEEVEALAGARYARKKGAGQPHRHGSNAGSVRIAGQRVPIRVPRIRLPLGVEVPLRSWAALSSGGGLDERLLRKVLYGISCRNYEAAAEMIPGAIGLSSSSVSRSFIRATATKLRDFKERSLSDLDLVAMVIDGKTFAEATMVIALGITLTGEKHLLGFVETHTENQKVLTPFLRSLIDRGLDASKGLLLVIDGSKGIRASVREVFGQFAAVQRCQWHKRENVVSYLPKGEQACWRKRLERAYLRPTHKEALSALGLIHKELDSQNQSAAGSLAEGLHETLTLHRLGVYGVLGCSLKTTNCLESINAQIEERCSKVDYWKNSNQRQRWLATALLDIEPRLKRIKGYRHLPKLREALKRELQIKQRKFAHMEVA